MQTIRILLSLVIRNSYCPVTQPINIIDVINGKMLNAKQNFQLTVNLILPIHGHLWQMRTVTVTITHIATNCSRTQLSGMMLIADGRWLHQMTVDYTGSGGKPLILI